jgi:hypothetical protein
MKLLKLKVNGLPLFEEDLDLSFYATQRVEKDKLDGLTNLFPLVYTNNIEMFAGINASGKTSVLKVILFAMDLLRNVPINQSRFKDILGKSKKVVFDCYYYATDITGSYICRIKTEVLGEKKPNYTFEYTIGNEEYWKKDISTVKTRKQLTDFSGIESEVRSNEEKYLPPDVSIIIAINKLFQGSISYKDLMNYTDNNTIGVKGIISSELIRFLDPTIESLSIEEVEKGTSVSEIIKLKFYGKDEITLYNKNDLNAYLSSGTIKGLTVFRDAEYTLMTGGYLVVDELENHFNKEIVSVLMGFFYDNKINKNGATLIFSTHYPELLDNVNRNDCIYITRNIKGITVENLSGSLKRNDIKKSDAYQSDLLKGTAPSYESYIKLKKKLKNLTR